MAVSTTDNSRYVAPVSDRCEACLQVVLRCYSRIGEDRVDVCRAAHEVIDLTRTSKGPEVECCPELADVQRVAGPVRYDTSAANLITEWQSSLSVRATADFDMAGWFGPGASTNGLPKQIACFAARSTST